MAPATRSRKAELGKRLWWLILGRVATVICLLIAGLLWTHGAILRAASNSLNVTMILLAVAALTAIYTAARLLLKNLLLQARVQFFFDVVLVTWLVWITGDIHSPYSALYIVIISVSSFFVGPRGAMITSIGSATAFNACAIGPLLGLGGSVTVASTEIANKIQSVGLSDVSFLIVGLLAARLAERQSRSDVQLAAATQSLANLRALHERIVESIRSGVITTDLQRRIYTFNTAAEEITFQDLTEIRSLEETSRRQDRLAAVGRLAASIAHEIRNPLAAMRGSIQMLRAEMEGNSEQAQLMEIILRESDRLNKIVADYLSYARPRPAQMNDVDPAVLLQDTFKLLSNSSEVSARHRLELDLPVEPIIVKGDEEQLRQVFWNVARNALKAMPHEGMLRASLERAGNSRACLSFTDTGCGMTAEQVERLFEPFSSTTGSTGLGLSIVYQIIRDHSGTINVHSRLGEGTMITIELPAERHESAVSNH